MVNDGDSLLYIEREYSSYFGNLRDIELDAYQRMGYHDKIELEKQKWLGKIPKGLFAYE